MSPCVWINSEYLMSQSKLFEEIYEQRTMKHVRWILLNKGGEAFRKVKFFAEMTLKLEWPELINRECDVFHHDNSVTHTSLRELDLSGVASSDYIKLFQHF